MNIVQRIRGGVARRLFSIPRVRGLAIHFACREDLFPAILESELLMDKFGRRESFIATLAALVTDEKILARLVSDEDVANKLLLYDAFIDYALSSQILQQRAFTNQKFLSALATDPAAWNRLLDSRLVDTIKSIPAALDRLVSVGYLQTRILEDPTLLNGVAGEGRFISWALSNRDFMDGIAQNSDASNCIVLEEDSFERLVDFLNRPENDWLASPDHVGKLFSVSHIRAVLETNPALLDAALSRPELDTNRDLLNDVISKFPALFIDAMTKGLPAALRDSEFRTQLFSSNEIVESAVREPTFLIHLLAHPRAVATITTDDRLLTAILLHPLSFDKILSDSTLLTKIVGHDRVVDKFLGDDVLLRRVLSSRRALETVAHEGTLLDKLLTIDNIYSHIAQAPFLFERMSANPRIVSAFRSTPRLLAHILDHGQAIEGLANEPSFSKQILSNDSAMKSLFRNRGMAERMLHRTPETDRLAGILEFQREWLAIRPVSAVASDPRANELAADAASKVNAQSDVTRQVLDLICVDNEVKLAHGALRFPDRYSLWVVLHEILIEEQYGFRTNREDPFILDCGSNFGMAIYYFKTRFPNARIIGFEPVPEIRELALQNCKANKFEDVEVLPFALSDTEGPASFYKSKDFPLAGSLTSRRREFGDRIEEIQIEQRRLSTFLSQPVDFLKLDIEGSEDRVLTECGPALRFVRNMFIEYHHGASLAPDRLGKILETITCAGFDFRIQSGDRSACDSNPSTGDHAQPYSLGIRAWNRSLDC